jgi:hypothetical protein
MGFERNQAQHQKIQDHLTIRQRKNITKKNRTKAKSYCERISGQGPTGGPGVFSPFSFLDDQLSLLKNQSFLIKTFFPFCTHASRFRSN